MTSPTRPADVKAHPRTYSLVGSPRLFLVTDDESGINIGYADKIGGPLVAPPHTKHGGSSGLSGETRSGESLDGKQVGAATARLRPDTTGGPR